MEEQKIIETENLRKFINKLELFVFFIKSYIDWENTFILSIRGYHNDV